MKTFLLFLFSVVTLRMECYSPHSAVIRGMSSYSSPPFLYRFRDLSKLRSKQTGEESNSPLESLQKWWKEKFSWQSSALGFFAGVTLSLSLIIAPIIQSTSILESSPITSEQQKEEINQLVQPTLLFQNILFDLQKDYIDVIDPMKLFKTGIKSMLQTLDPYTEFEDLQESTQMQESVSGKYAGVGMVIADIRPPESMTQPEFQRLYPANVQVVNAFEGYAFDEGVRPGDLILSVNGIDTTRKTSLEVKQLLRGDPNSLVKMRLLRDFSPPTMSKSSDSEDIYRTSLIKDVRFKRSGVQLSDIRLATLIGHPEEGIGYINIAGFNSGLARDFRNAVYLLRMNTLQDLKGLVIDLRDNPGGLLDAAVEIASYLLPENSEIVTSKGRNGQEIVYRSTNSGSILSKDTKLVILINKGSASAAEILAGAIQDYDAGVIIGTSPSFGKGLVQKIVNLPYQSALKYTTAKYYTPSGRCIQEIQYLGGREDTEASQMIQLKQLQTESKNQIEELDEKESIPIYDPSPVVKYQQNKIGIRNKILPSPPPSTLNTAEDFILPESTRQTFYTKRLHRPVRDGKGIEPDLILPNTIELSPSEGLLIVENLLNDFIDQYYLPQSSHSHLIRQQLSQALTQEKITRNAVIDYYRDFITNTLQGITTSSKSGESDRSTSPTSLSQASRTPVAPLPLSKSISQFLMSGLDNFHQAMILNDIIHVPSMEQFYVLNHHYQNPPNHVTDVSLPLSKEKPGGISPKNLLNSVIQTPIDAHFFYGDLLAASSSPIPSPYNPSSSPAFATYQQFRQDLFQQFQQYLDQRFSSIDPKGPTASTLTTLKYASLFENEIQAFQQISTLFPSLSSLIQSLLQQQFLPTINTFIAKDILSHQESITQTLESLLLKKEFPNRLITYYQLQQDPQVAIAQQLLQSTSSDHLTEKTIPIQKLFRNGFMYRKVLPEYMKQLNHQKLSGKGQSSPSQYHSLSKDSLSTESFIIYDDLLPQVET